MRGARQPTQVNESRRTGADYYVEPEDIRIIYRRLYGKSKTMNRQKERLVSRDLLLTRFPHMTRAAQETTRWVIPQLDKQIGYESGCD